MKRDELRNVITAACDRADVADGHDRRALIASAEKIDRIATGQFSVRDDEGVSCGCPALVAGIYTYDPEGHDVIYTGAPYSNSSLFPGAFDRIILREHRDDVVWIDEDSGYIPVED